MSGGIWGLEVGDWLMAGGSQTAFDRVEPVLAASRAGACRCSVRSPVRIGVEEDSVLAALALAYASVSPTRPNGLASAATIRRV
jgi:6-phosphogluconate dehydrogenase (decarboxylating)